MLAAVPFTEDEVNHVMQLKKRIESDRVIGWEQ